MQIISDMKIEIVLNKRKKIYQELEKFGNRYVGKKNGANAWIGSKRQAKRIMAKNGLQQKIITLNYKSVTRQQLNHNWPERDD